MLKAFTTTDQSRGGTLVALLSWYLFSAVVLFAAYYMLVSTGVVGSIGVGLAIAALGPLVCAAPLLAAIAHVTRKSQQLRTELTRAATYDQTSGCLNDRTFAGLVERRMNRQSETGAQGALLLVEVDNLWIMQTLPDESWLRRIAATVRGSVRSGDFVGRISPDGFGVFLPGATNDDAVAVGRRIQSAIASLGVGHEGMPARINVSVAGIVYEGDVSYGALLRATAGRLPRAATHVAGFEIARYQPGGRLPH